MRHMCSPFCIVIIRRPEVQPEIQLRIRLVVVRKWVRACFALSRLSQCRPEVKENK